MTARITQQQLESYPRAATPARHHRRWRLQAVHLSATVLQAPVRRVRRGDADRAGRVDGDQQFSLFPENHRFQIPSEAHWRRVRQTATDVGALQNALRAIETANPDKLYGIFGDAQWTTKTASPTPCCATWSSILARWS